MAIKLIAIKSKVELRCLITRNAISCRYIYVPYNFTGTYGNYFFFFFYRKVAKISGIGTRTSYFHLFQDARISIAFRKCTEEIGQSRTRDLKALVLLSVRFQKYDTFLQALTTSVSFLHV